MSTGGPELGFSVPPALPYVSELDDPIAHDEVLQAIARLKSKRAPGTDGIPVEVYMALSGYFTSLLTDLFIHIILCTGHYPHLW